MTSHYDIVKMYHRHDEIRVCAISLEQLKKGETELLEHIVLKEETRQDGKKYEVVKMIPSIKPYCNYKLDICDEHKR